MKIENPNDLSAISSPGAKGAVGLDTANRAAKVEQLRGQVVEGGYNPDPVEISRGIVNDALANAATAGSSRR